jgi:hypothetical protein
MDYPDVGSLAMPSALLVVHGQQDSLFPPDGVKAAIDSLRQSYQAIGIGIPIPCSDFFGWYEGTTTLRLIHYYKFTTFRLSRSFNESWNKRNDFGLAG